MQKEKAWQIRYYEEAEQWLRETHKEGTLWAEYILKLASGPAKRAERRANKPKPTGDKKEWTRAHESANEAFSTYIRTRDTRPFPDGIRRGHCSTCGAFHEYSELQCGHWQSRKHWGTKFHPMNCNAQDWACNSKMMGNGRMPEHEAYIRRVHGDQWIQKLLVLVKTNARKKSIPELWAIASEFKKKTDERLARESL